MRKHFAITSAVLCLAILAGCGKSAKENTAAVTTPGPAPETAVAQVQAPEVKNFAYYGAHLEEAKKTMEQCRTLKPEEVSPEVMARCKTAISAWHMQPYKPGSQN